MKSYLFDPIPRYKAFLGVGLAFSTTVLTYFSAKALYEETIREKNQNIHVLMESVHFLLQRAEVDTILELEEKLEFWSIILGVPPSTEV